MQSAKLLTKLTGSEASGTVNYPAVRHVADFPTQRPQCVVYHLSGGSRDEIEGGRFTAERSKTDKVAANCRVIIGRLSLKRAAFGKIQSKGQVIWKNTLR